MFQKNVLALNAVLSDIFLEKKKDPWVEFPSFVDMFYERSK